MRKKFFLPLVLLVFLSLFTRPVYAAVTWSETQPAGNVNKFWDAGALSQDGSTIVVTTQNTAVYLSTNSGNNWAEVLPKGVPATQWQTVAISSNGQVIAVAGQDGMYISTNQGGSWTAALTGSGANNFTSVSMSSDGKYMIGGSYLGRLYISTNTGANWTEVQPAGNANKAWQTVSISADGQLMLAGILSGRLYRSTDGGSNWSEVQPAGNTNQDWYLSTMSSDGQNVFAGVNGGRVYRSTDRGDSWSEVRPIGDANGNWHGIGISYDGQTVFISASTGRLYLSSNGGTSWSETQPIGDVSKSWWIAAVSGNSEKLLSGYYISGRLYLGSNPAPTPSPTPTAAPGVSNSAPSLPTPTAPSCTDSAPVGTPSIFQTDTAGTYANLYFQTISGSSGYNITYGLTPSANQYGDKFGYSGNLWTVGRTISALQPNTTYYFKVQAVNGCSTGSWSSVVSAKTKNPTANITQFFANLNPFNSRPSLISSKSTTGQVAGISTSATCQYIVQPGDSFWQIAGNKLGNHARFGELTILNPGITLLRIGQLIKIC